MITLDELRERQRAFRCLDRESCYLRVRVGFQLANRPVTVYVDGGKDLVEVLKIPEHVWTVGRPPNVIARKSLVLTLRFID